MGSSMKALWVMRLFFLSHSLSLFFVVVVVCWERKRREAIELALDQFGTSDASPRQFYFSICPEALGLGGFFSLSLAISQNLF